MENLICKVCQVEKPLSDYLPRNLVCRQCVRKRYNDKLKNDNTEEYLFRKARKRARAKGQEFSITVSDVVIPEFCPYLGLKIQVGTGKFIPGSPSLDRIDNTKGYIPGNVEVISHRANSMKSGFGIEQLRQFALAILERAEKNPASN